MTKTTRARLRMAAAASRTSAARLCMAAAALAAASCGDAETDDGSGTIRIGALFDLTGPTADVGTDYAEGVRAWVEWTNGRGGIEGRQVELDWEDFGYDVARAEQAYSRMAGRGVVAFMGWGTGDTEALHARVADDQIPFSSASLSHRLGDPQEAPYNFLVATSYSDQFRIALEWIARDHQASLEPGPLVVALLHAASPFGLSPARQGGADFAEARGIDLVLHEMPRGAVDYTAELSRIRQSGARYVVIQNTSGPAAQALRDARSLGMDQTFLCLNWCANALLVRLAGGAVEGMLGTVPYAPLTIDVPGTRVIREHLEAKGESPESKTNGYTQGWWTIAVFGEAIRRVVASGREPTGPAVKAELETFADFDMGGATVPLTFTPDDHRGAKGLRIFRVEGGQWVPLTDFLQAPATP